MTTAPSWPTADEFIARKRSEVGRTFKAKDIGRLGHHVWLPEAGTYMQQTNLPEKVFAFERIRLVRRAEGGDNGLSHAEERSPTPGDRSVTRPDLTFLG